MEDAHWKVIGESSDAFAPQPNVLPGVVPTRGFEPRTY